MKYLFKEKNKPQSTIGYLTILIHLSGEGFDPKQLIQIIDYPCTILQNIGDKVKSGRNKGKVATGGWCCYELDDNVPYEGKISNAVELYLKVKKINQEMNLHIDWFDFSLLFSGDQGNMELSKDEIKELSKLDIGIAMTYINASEIDYKKQKKLFKIKHKLYYED